MTRAKKPARREMVLVEWVDSLRSNVGWAPVAEHLVRGSQLACASVGFLVADEDDRVTICAHDSLETLNVVQCMTIPRVSITRMVRLAEERS